MKDAGFCGKYCRDKFPFILVSPSKDYFPIGISSGNIKDIIPMPSVTEASFSPRRDFIWWYIWDYFHSLPNPSLFTFTCSVKSGKNIVPRLPSLSSWKMFRITQAMHYGISHHVPYVYSFPFLFSSARTCQNTNDRGMFTSTSNVGKSDHPRSCKNDTRVYSDGRVWSENCPWRKLNITPCFGEHCFG